MRWRAGLATGATIVLFDGAPLQPDPKILWRLAAEERVTIFGTGPRFLTTCERQGAATARGVRSERTTDRDIDRRAAEPGKLSIRLSRRAPRRAALIRFRRHGHHGVLRRSLPGAAGLMKGEIQALGLGMKVEVFDEAGRPLIGQQGELVKRAPSRFPSVPVGFWGDARRPIVSWPPISRAIRMSGGTATWPPSPPGQPDRAWPFRCHCSSGVRIGTAELYRQPGEGRRGGRVGGGRPGIPGRRSNRAVRPAARRPDPRR